MHAHHVFPQRFEKVFTSMGINIHDPKYLSWWEAASHRINARQYNAKWAEFMQGNPSTDQILDYGKKLMSEYGNNVNY